MHKMVENILLKGLQPFASLIMGHGKHARLSILIYHRVLEKPDPLLNGEVDAQAFDRQMKLLAEHFNVLPLSEALTRLRSHTLPSRSVCITFDDGYADNVGAALPVLKHRQVPATFFISTGFLNGKCMWNDAVIEAVRTATGPMLNLMSIRLGTYSISTVADRHRTLNQVLPALKYLFPAERERRILKLVEVTNATLPESLMMNPKQVRSLYDAGMEIGGHTVSHPILTSIDLSSARAEISNGKTRLEDICDSRVSLFAYPNGKPSKDYNSEHVKLIENLGFSAAVSTSWRTSTARSDLYQLPRFTPWDKDPIIFVLRLIDNCLRNKTVTV